VRVERPSLVEIAWGEAGNEEMPPGSTRLIVRFTARGGGTLVELEHRGLTPSEVTKHGMGWPHFRERLRVPADGSDPGPDPWATKPLTTGLKGDRGGGKRLPAAGPATTAGESDRGSEISWGRFLRQPPATGTAEIVVCLRPGDSVASDGLGAQRACPGRWGARNRRRDRRA
jgi:hypothetical protein